ncbi:MAG TPA: PP2C family protein-serine/threonine phosphatase, partial [Leptospiraceae bacterium]|nr:PP2C family protein-serine/threonine phosphatase [Leptospiraceae bacterium]
MDFIQSEDGRLYIFLGDITGHGVGSGLLVSAVKAIIRSNVEMNRPLQKIFETINRFLNERYPGFEFMSLFGLVYDSQSSSSEYINAGHVPPVIIGKNGDRRRFEATETLLGVAPGRYPSVRLSLEPGDKMFVFSDGIVEALNPA